MSRYCLYKKKYTNYLNADESDKRSILKAFEISFSFHLPVVRDRMLLGIVCIFDITRSPDSEIELTDFLQTDCYVAAADTLDIFSFSQKEQTIVPFVDEAGHFLYFINRIASRCFLPNREYLHKIEDCSDRITDSQLLSAINVHLQHDPDFLLILSPEHGAVLSGDSADTAPLRRSFVRVFQAIQTRKELTLYRIAEPKHYVQYDLDEMRQELVDFDALAKTYRRQFLNVHSGVIRGKHIVFQSPQSKQAFRRAVNVARFDSTVLLLGESGVGKSLFASIIHENSSRRNAPFLTIDCASLPSSLIESELFGYEPGSFTDAKKSGKEGLVELANGGTLFLDEISELPLELQGKLLRLIQERRFYRIGSTTPTEVDIRIITATNRDLRKMVDAGTFRKDLYFRISVIPIIIPRLRERQEDIIPLINNILHDLNKKYGMSKTIHPSAYQRLTSYTWPGNIRELENTIEYMFVVSEGETISADAFARVKKPQEKDLAATIEGASFSEAAEEHEKKYLELAHQRCKDIPALAEKLSVNRSTVIRKLMKHGIYKK